MPHATCMPLSQACCQSCGCFTVKPGRAFSTKPTAAGTRRPITGRSPHAWAAYARAARRLAPAQCSASSGRALVRLPGYHPSRRFLQKALLGSAKCVAWVCAAACQVTLGLATLFAQDVSGLLGLWLPTVMPRIAEYSPAAPYCCRAMVQRTFSLLELGFACGPLALCNRNGTWQPNSP